MLSNRGMICPLTRVGSIIPTAVFMQASIILGAKSSAKETNIAILVVPVTETASVATDTAKTVAKT